MTLRADVAIVGSGLAGATLAALLARRGVPVVTIDRSRFPRDKVCGEFLSYDALPVLDRLGLLSTLDAAGASRIRRCRIVGRKQTLEFEFPRAARGISRLFLDDHLLQCAERSGATSLTGWTVTGIDGNTITASNENGAMTVEAKAVVGAWGRWGRLDAQFGRSFIRDRNQRHFGYKRHYRRNTTVAPSDAIELYAYPRGYVGVNDIEGDETNICGLVHGDRLARHRGRWEGFVNQLTEENPHLARMFARYEPVQEDFLSSDPVIFRARSVVERGVFLVGDASGVIDPLTGNGMAMAIQSAVLLAPFILEALASASGERAAVEKAWTAAHHRFVGRRIAVSRVAAPLLSQPLLLDVLLGVARVPAAGRFFLERTRAAEGSVERMLDRWFC